MIILKKHLLVAILIIVVLVISGFVVRGSFTETEIKETGIYTVSAAEAPVTFVQLYAADGRAKMFPSHMKDAQMSVGWYETRKDAAKSKITQKDIDALAAVMYIEARGLDTREVAMVAWCVLNRVDRGDGSISGICYSNQFALYHTNAAYHNKTVYAWLAEDVLTRYYLEKMGETAVGRVLPPNYYYFTGDGKHNYFRADFYGPKQLNSLFEMENPYKQ